MKTLYDILEVKEDSSDSIIKQAYRDKAKQSHPDIIGNEGKINEFNKISHAYRILSDGVKRLTYDETGDDSESQPIDLVRRRALEQLGSFMSEIASNISQHYTEIVCSNLFEDLTDKINLKMEETHNNIEKAIKSKELIKKFRKRIKFNGKKGADFFSDVINKEYLNLTNSIKVFEHSIDIFKEAKHILDDYEFIKKEMEEKEYSFTGIFASTSESTSAA